jgi:hypothetical protein
MIKLILSNILLVVFLSLSGYSQTAPSNSHKKKSTLLFKSGFEKGVYLKMPWNDEGGCWYQDVKGSDNPNFSWPITLWDARGTFQVLVGSKLNSKEYIQNKIVTVKGHDGRMTRAMLSKVIKADKNWTQDPYLITEAKENGDLYIKYWLKFPSHLSKVLGDGSNDDGWCTFFEWKTAGDYRIAAYVYINKGINKGKPYWYVHGDNVAKDDYGKYEEFWSEENYSIPVPEDKWFQVEFFWHRSTGKDGRFWWAINGKVVADHHGPNKILEPINRIMLFTVYSAKYPLSQYVDDIEIWDGFPPKKKISCRVPKK